MQWKYLDNYSRGIVAFKTKVNVQVHDIEGKFSSEDVGQHLIMEQELSYSGQGHRI